MAVRDPQQAGLIRLHGPIALTHHASLQNILKRRLSHTVRLVTAASLVIQAMGVRAFFSKRRLLDANGKLNRRVVTAEEDLRFDYLTVTDSKNFDVAMPLTGQ